MNDWYTKQLARIERAQASDREVARLTGVTIEELDADTTASDERAECTECSWFSCEPGHFTGSHCCAPHGCVYEQVESIPLPPPMDHRVRISKGNRQTCCDVCHKCQTKCVQVLDGELWCPTCQAYR